MLRFPWLVIRKFREHLCLERAATLAFATILSLIPLSVLFFSFAGRLGVGEEHVIPWAKEQLFPLVAPDFQTQLSGWLDEYISKDAFDSGLVDLAGFLGFVFLVGAALGVLHTAERIVNRIWDARRARTFLQRFTAFWVILTISPFVLVASSGVKELLIPQGGTFQRVVADHLLLQWLYAILVPTCLGFFAFTIVNLFLPATRVRVTSAALGGMVAAVLWEISKLSFVVYVDRVTSVHSAIGIVPLFLVWVYLTWLIVLLGAIVAYVHQNYEVLLELVRLRQSAVRYPPFFLGLCLLEEVGRAYRGERPPPSSAEVAARLSVPEEWVADVSKTLVEGGVLVEAVEPDGGLVPARAPESIALSRIAEVIPLDDVPLALLEDDRGKDSRALQVFQTARRGYVDSLGSGTLADL